MALAKVFSKSGTETTCPMLAKMQWSVHSAMGCLCWPISADCVAGVNRTVPKPFTSRMWNWG